MLHEVKGNPLKMNGKIDIFSREIETIKEEPNGNFRNEKTQSPK